MNGASVIFSLFIGVELTCWKALTLPQVTAGFDPKEKLTVFTWCAALTRTRTI
jgi:hypothetical protein